MAVAETNKIITHGDGQSIATSIQNIANAINDQEKNVHLSDAQTITGAKTFTSPIKTSEIDNTAGNAMLRDKDTEGAIVLGSVSKKAVIMGSGDRPTYSKDGSDFAGSELALFSDIGSISMSTLLGSLGAGRWANHSFIVYSWKSSARVIYDNLMPYYNSYIRMFQNWNFTGATTPIYFDKDTKANVSMNFWFYQSKATGTIYLPNHIDNRSLSIYNYEYASLFDSSAFSKILIKDGCEFDLICSLYYTFARCPNLTEIGAFDVSRVGSFSNWLDGSTKIKSIHCKHFKISFSISQSTAFEEADLVEILNNLDPVSTTQTLTMGATNLAKLTSDDILIATGKGWALA